MLVHAVGRLRVQLQIDRLAPRGLARPVGRGQFRPTQVLIAILGI